MLRPSESGWRMKLSWTMKLNDVGALWCCGGASHGKFYGVYCHHVLANRIPFIAPPFVGASPLKIQLDFDVAGRFFSSVRWIRKCKQPRSSPYNESYYSQVEGSSGYSADTLEGKRWLNAVVTWLHIRMFWEELMISKFHVTFLSIQTVISTHKLTAIQITGLYLIYMRKI